MSRIYTEIDAGHTLINMAVEEGRNGPIITAFVNGLSVRSSSLVLPRVVTLFTDAVLAACDFPDEEGAIAEAYEAGTERAIRDFIGLNAN
jgi:hypothetical protein